MSICSWRLMTSAMAALCAACSIQPIKLELASDHPAQPRAQAAPWPQLAAPLSADDAVRLALAYSPALQADYAQLGIARADVIAASTLANPVLSLERRSSSVGTQRGIGIMQDLLGVLTMPARKQLAQRNLAQAQVESAQRVLAHGYAVRGAYYTLQGDAQTLELMRQAGSATAAAAELAQRQFAAGNVSRLQLAQHQAFDAETQLELARAQSQLAIDGEKFNSLIGVWGSNTGWKLPPRLPVLPPHTPPLDAVEATALAQRLDIAAAKQALESTHATLAFTRNNRFLSALGVGFSRTRESDGERLKGPHVEIGLPLFERAQAEIARLQASSATQEHSLRQLAIDVRAQARAARERLTAAYARARQYEGSVLPLHASIVGETQLRYNGMLVDVYELLAAKRAQLASARGYVESLREFWLAQVELERTMGARLEQSATRSAPSTPSSTAPSSTTPATPGGASNATSPDHQHHKQ